MRTLALALVMATPLPALAADPLPDGALMRFGTLKLRAPILGFGIDKDGTVVTVGPRWTLSWWRATDDRPHKTIVIPYPDPNAEVLDLVISSDGSRIAASVNWKIYIWETPKDTNAKLKVLATLDLQKAYAVQFSPDGGKLVVKANMNDIWSYRLYDIKTGKIIEPESKAKDIDKVAFSDDGTRLAVRSESELEIFDSTTGKRLATYRKSDGWVLNSFTLNQKGTQLLLRSLAGKWVLLDTMTGKKLDGLTAPDGRGFVSFTSNGKSILMGDPDSGFLWWDPVAGKLISKFAGWKDFAYSAPYSARFTTDGKTLVAHNGHVLQRWNAETGKALFPEQSEGHGEEIFTVAMSPDGKHVVTRGQDEYLCLWDAATCKRLWHLEKFWSNTPHLHFSPDGKFLYTQKRGSMVKLDAMTGKEVLQFKVELKIQEYATVQSSHLSADGKTLLALIEMDDDPELIVKWDTATGKMLSEKKLPSNIPWHAELSPCGQFVSVDRAVFAVTDLEANLLDKAAIRGQFTTMQFSDDGKYLILTTTDREEKVSKHMAYVISTATWRIGFSVPMAKEGVAALSADASTLAVAFEGTLEFHDIATSKLIGQYQLPIGEWRSDRFDFTTAIRFSPDGKKLITAHYDTTALVWQVPKRAVK